VSPPPLTIEPLLLAPCLLEKVWGGRRLETLGKSLPPGARIGESWELADLGSTSASGAGGQAVRSTIVGGPLAGRTLKEAMQAWGAAMLGELSLTPEGGFPLLVKFLDASQNLSVQVHPSPAYAATHPDAHLKTESWYIVSAEPGAALYIGLRSGVKPEAFAAAARANSPEAAEMLQRVAAAPGECHTLPSGTVHALGAGVTVAEMQTPSDTTYRLYDWGRTGRELHIEPGLASMSDPTVGPPVRASLGADELCGRLATTPYYTIDEARPLAGDEVTIGYACKHHAPAPFVLMVIHGEGELRHAAGEFSPRTVRAGQTLLIPAAIARHTTVRGGEGLRVLRIGLCA
jgi:mannose-6-phosphate isomerase